MGGIYDWHDALEYLLLGATTVQVCTAAMELGFGLADELADGLSRWMDRKGYTSIQELIGNGVPAARKVVRGSCIRCAVVSFPAVPCDTVRITLEKTWGANTFRMFEARIYAADA